MMQKTCPGRKDHRTMVDFAVLLEEIALMMVASAVCAPPIAFLVTQSN